MSLTEQYRRVARLCLVLVLVVAGSATMPAAVEAGTTAVTSQRLVDTCQDDAANSWTEFNDSFYCLGPQKQFQIPVASYPGVCFDLSAPYFQDAGHPAPNGWSNAISSAVNNDRHRIHFYDAFGCAGPVLFTMQPHTYRDTLNTLANNKASSVEFQCVNLDCS